MKNIISYIFLFLTMFTMSCTSEEKGVDTGEFDYLVFGESFGFCAGDCTTLFKLENGKIFPDEVDNNYQGVDNLIFSAQDLGVEKYNSARILLEDFPGELMDNDKQVYGIPDAYDQGKYLIFLKKGEEIRSWVIDHDLKNIENEFSEVKSYGEKIQDVLEDIK